LETPSACGGVIHRELAKREFEKFEDKIFSNSVWGFLQDIKRELKEFKPFRIVH